MAAMAQNEVKKYGSDLFAEEPHFVFKNTNWIRIHANIPDERFLQYIDYSIRKQSTDLLSHVRKIAFLQDQQDQENLNGAINALFSILGEKGLPLKKNILNRSKNILNAADYDRLVKNTEIQNIPTSDGGLDKTDSFISEFEQPQYDQLQPVDTGSIAESYIENGQLEEAMDCLEEYLLTHLDDPELGQTLGDLYFSSGEKIRLDAFVDDISKRGNPIPHYYIEIQKKFEAS